MKYKNRIIPCLGYKDAFTAIEWLCLAFGFEKKMVLENAGKIAHSELSYEGNLIMVGSSDSGSDWSKLIKLPAEVAGFETQSAYIIVDNIDAHYERAKSQGVKIVKDLREEDFGGKNYSCYDPEGHLWTFGSYDPWVEK
jgi:uncharacterized glyoxalase superfamily protein PhnB